MSLTGPRLGEDDCSTRPDTTAGSDAAADQAGASTSCQSRDALRRTALVRRARRINRELAWLYPDARNELNFTSPLELLVAAILSAQTTDRRVNEVTQVLFVRYCTAADYAAADCAELERLIKPTGFFRAKARHLISLGQALCDRFGGKVPDTLGELLTLPGVGRKTANILGDAFGKPSLTVDIHFARLARRFGLDSAYRPGKDRARRRCAPAAPGVDRSLASADLARAPGLPCPRSGVWGMLDRPAVPVVRRGSHRPGDRTQSRQTWAIS